MKRREVQNGAAVYPSERRVRMTLRGLIDCLPPARRADVIALARNSATDAGLDALERALRNPPRTTDTILGSDQRRLRSGKAMLWQDLPDGHKSSA